MCRLSRRRNVAVRAEVAPWCGIWTRRVSGKDEMATVPERPASNQRDTVKEAELIVSVMSGDIDRVHQLTGTSGSRISWPRSSRHPGTVESAPSATRILSVLTVVAIGLLASAAVLLFVYTQKLDLRRLQVAQASLMDPPPNMYKEWGANSRTPTVDGPAYATTSATFVRVAQKLALRAGLEA